MVSNVSVSGKATVNGQAVTHQARGCDDHCLRQPVQKSKVRARLTGSMLITVTDQEKCR